MRMLDAITLLLTAVGISAFVALVWPATRKYLLSPRGWVVAVSGAITLSAASWLIAEERMGGTILQLRHGWPKFFSLQCIASECPWGWTFEWIHFVGNSFFYGAVLVLVCTGVAILRVFFDRQPKANGRDAGSAKLR